ncbi:MAG TPA: sulfotransferase [Steroidobacteraceae bacterium]|nr:sulfotransferase [Steroidobacteraceae bacterium]
MPDPSSVELEVERVRQLIDGQRFAEARAAAATLLVTFPENRDALYACAHAQRRLGEIPAALETLSRLERWHPRFSRTHQERGFCHVALRQAPEAIEAFRRAVSISPVLPVSWSMLEGLYRMTGQAAEAAQSAAQVARLRELPPEVVTAAALFSDGELARAEDLVSAFLRKHGHHIEAMRLLANIAMERDIQSDAQVLLEGVLKLSPDYHAARFDYAQVLSKRQRHLEAEKQMEKLLAVDRAHRGYLTLHALTQVGLGRHERAIELYRQLLPGSHQPAELHLSIAHLLKTLGRTEAAIAEYRAAAATRAGYGDAYWSLANLKTYRFSDEELGRMIAAEAAPATSDVDRYHLCFALGKALEDRQEYPRSFEYYTRGNALTRAASPYRPEQIERSVRLQIEVCTPALFAHHRGGGAGAADPIFIVGLPRAGSTLIEQILASHSQVEGTHELADVPRIVADLDGRDSQYPRLLSRMSTEDFRLLGERYLSETRAYRSEGRARFIDKMPNNFRHLGLIHLMLPNAKIIDVRREPMACCLGNFKQLFAQGQAFTYGLEDIARYYRTYLELMRHWDVVLPGRVLRLHYEDVVDDVEGSVRRLLEFCELEFEPACVAFYRTERSVRTASSEQVRQPIYREGLSQWRHFEPWLAPLHEALGDALWRYRE